MCTHTYVQIEQGSISHAEIKGFGIVCIADQYTCQLGSQRSARSSNITRFAQNCKKLIERSCRVAETGSCGRLI